MLNAHDRAAESLGYPAIPVKNSVLWVNPHFNLPYYLREGEPSELGVFVVGNPSLPNITLVLQVDNYHGRSGLVKRSEFYDDQGVKYRDLDLKGAAYLEKNLDAGKPEVAPIAIRDEESTWGIWRLEKAQREVGITEDINTQGVRTNRIGALILLEEIALPNGTKISISQAQKQGLLHSDEQPVVAPRLYRQRERYEHPWQLNLEAVPDSKSFAEDELGTQLSWHEFLVWCAQTSGTNLARVYNAGYWHGSADLHNNTRMVELVDFGFGDISSAKRVTELTPGELRAYLEADYRTTGDCLGRLCGDVQHALKVRDLIPGTRFWEIFLQTFNQESRYQMEILRYHRLIPHASLSKKGPTLIDRLKGLVRF